MKAGRLTIRVVPGGRSGCVFDVLQPSRLVKSSELRERVVPVTVSLRSTNIDSKASPPVFWNSRSTHQPVPVQLSILLKEAVKAGGSEDVGEGVDVGVGEDVDVDVGVGVGVKEGVGVGEDVGVGENVAVAVGEVVGVEDVSVGVGVMVGEAVGIEDVFVDVGVNGRVGVRVGARVGVEVRTGVRVRVGVDVKKGALVRVGVGVGGGVNTGTLLAIPVRVAFCPLIQQLLSVPSGSRITQKFPSALRPTTSATSPTRNTPTRS